MQQQAESQEYVRTLTVNKMKDTHCPAHEMEKGKYKWKQNVKKRPRISMMRTSLIGRPSLRRYVPTFSISTRKVD